MLWQRFGRAGRGEGTAVAILLAEKKYFDEERVKTAEKKAKRKAAGNQGGRPAKHIALAPLGLANNEMQAEVLGSEDENTPEVDDEARRALYNKRNTADEKLSKKKVDAIDIGVDDLINAVSRGIKCRRKVSTLYFGNDKCRESSDLIVNITSSTTCSATDDHMKCDETNPLGCPRCCPKLTDICCDICNPTELQDRLTTLTIARPTRAPPKSHIKPYTKTLVHFNLRDKIFEWRLENAVKKLGVLAIRKYGPELFLSDQLVDRIVDCAHHGKITLCDHLLKETHWRKDRVDEFGESLLTVLRSLPLSLAAPVNSALPSISAKAPVKERRCGACGITGHNRGFVHSHSAHFLTVP